MTLLSSFCILYHIFPTPAGIKDAKHFIPYLLKHYKHGRFKEICCPSNYGRGTKTEIN